MTDDQKKPQPPRTGMAMKFDAFNAFAAPLDQAASLHPDPSKPAKLEVVPPGETEPSPVQLVKDD